MADKARTALSDAAATAGFQVETMVLEAVGLCPECVVLQAEAPA